jgi:alpha-mannosidase
MLGMSLSSDMGGTSTVGYLPDSFGFMGQVPQLLKGFGIRTFVSGRFANKNSSEGHWIGPDGSSVLYAFLANWYCHAALTHPIAHPESAVEAHRMLADLDADLGSGGAKSKHRLAMSGCDHYMTDPEVGNHIQNINTMAASLSQTNATDAKLVLVQTNLDDYMALLESDLIETNVQLPVVRGEVRENVDNLINSASTKMSVKQSNFKIQTLLERWVEPMEAFGWSLTFNNSNGRPTRLYDSDRIWHAWKPVLQTHAHDSICSTSASSVIHDIANRLSRAEQSTYRMLGDQAGQVVPTIVRMMDPQGPITS